MSITVDQPIDVPPGLRNVVVTETELGDVRGQEGFYHYRQYSAIELAQSKTLEDVWFLMFEGRLPTPDERAQFIARIAPLRQLPPEVRNILPAIATAGAEPLTKPANTGTHTGSTAPEYGAGRAAASAVGLVGRAPGSVAGGVSGTVVPTGDGGTTSAGAGAVLDAGEERGSAVGPQGASVVAGTSAVAGRAGDGGTASAGSGGVLGAGGVGVAEAGDGGAKFDVLAGLRSALSVYGAVRGLAPLWDLDVERRKEDALLVCAVTPTILAALYRLRQGEEPLEPRADLGAAANWLYMVTGREPGPDQVRAIEQYLIATVDHGFNASTFTARVIASTGADVVSAVAGAIGAFSGPLHGGAPDRALASLDEIGTPDRIDDWVRQKVASGERIMGFGHAVYRTEDPRSVMLRETAQHLGGELVDFATAVERRVVEILAEMKPGRDLYANVEFYAGVVMESCGLPRSMFTPTFAVSRVIGWTANILEQAAHPKIIRPSARYVGPPPPAPIPT